jgi:acyl transferase domain-containing protein
LAYFEAHGTGTALGDPIEAQGIGLAFAEAGGGPKDCPVGSAKTNLGHLEAAAGLAGLLKVVLALEHEAIPPSLHFETLNPQVDLGSLRVATRLEAWPAQAGRRWASVSSFGSGGANAHVVLEGAPSKMADGTSADQGSAGLAGCDEDPTLFVLSAKSPEQLRAYASTYAHWLAKEGRKLPLAALAHASRTQREAMGVRLAWLVQSHAELAEKLHAFVKTGSKDPVASGPLDEAPWRTLAQRWLQGEKVAWPTPVGPPMPRVQGLPTYPFARHRYWIDGRLAEPTIRETTSKPANSNAATETTTKVAAATTTLPLLWVPRWRVRKADPSDTWTSSGPERVVVLVLVFGRIFGLWLRVLLGHPAMRLRSRHQPGLV